MSSLEEAALILICGFCLIYFLALLPLLLCEILKQIDLHIEKRKRQDLVSYMDKLRRGSDE